MEFKDSTLATAPLLSRKGPYRAMGEATRTNHRLGLYPYGNSPECSRAARILAAKKYKRRKIKQLPFCAFCAFSRLSPFGCGCAALCHPRSVFRLFVLTTDSTDGREDSKGFALSGALEFARAFGVRVLQHRFARGVADHSVLWPCGKTRFLYPAAGVS